MAGRVGVGKRMTISISKTRNRTAIRKNRNENGIRALERGEKPHSNGLAVSRLSHGVEDLDLKNDMAVLMIMGIMIANMRLIIIVIIM